MIEYPTIIDIKFYLKDKIEEKEYNKIIRFMEDLKRNSEYNEYKANKYEKMYLELVNENKERGR